MEGSHFFDPVAAVLVFGGTIVATVMRCGWGDARAALREFGLLFGRGFDANRAKSELAIQVQDIEAQGFLGAEPRHFGDGEFDEVTDELIRTRSIKTIHSSHEAHRAKRMDAAQRATTFFAAAADLGPVLGLAGTLISLGGLSSFAAATGNFAESIGMAVATTLYGLVAANFIFAPLAAVVDRKAQAEDKAREQMIDWLASAIEASLRRHPEAAAREAA
ncbi:MotA/TolQ/ExbB proton channel family protein [Croceibacterium sp. LX-88]|uniref:MotA/TolQ/ExbB proton channel family protein n=1 Tax=Croceibacterium selenioxidans TaxID=2838833 RepID=A0ABS5W0B4_9SPHN|nr:MotA/TolQ/ExbB proton channel family protein [Croceibacterium selenioxidans]MBT2133211.1 MotA/TolQ/ExbB proton channel family protein [Croceibacterium selenioxidans]